MIYLYGASGHAKVILEILELQQKAIGGLLDCNTEIGTLQGYDVHFDLVQSYDPQLDSFLIAIGDNRIRKEIVAHCVFGPYSQAIHPFSVLSKSALIGVGTVVMAGVVVNSDARIGQHVILNTNCSVDHDCQVGDFVHISPNAALAGGVHVGEGSHIGIGASVIPGIKIGKWTTIGAGTVVIRDVPDYAVVVGNPGTVLKYNFFKEDLNKI